MTRKNTNAEHSVNVDEQLVTEFEDDLPDDIIEAAQEYVDTRAESDDAHWHQENVSHWH